MASDDLRVKRDIRALGKEELREFFKSNNQAAFRADQVYSWLWEKGVHDFDSMTNLSKETRQLLSEYFVINNVSVVRSQRSYYGTIKTAIRLYHGL